MGSERKGAAHMAFNPFHGFRKHSRVIFAILTIICMITFVLVGTGMGGRGGGGGDFFDWFLGLIGQSRKGDLYTTLYGSKVYQRDVLDRRSDRDIANTFLGG